MVGSVPSPSVGVVDTESSFCFGLVWFGWFGVFDPIWCAGGGVGFVEMRDGFRHNAICGRAADPPDLGGGGGEV